MIHSVYFLIGSYLLIGLGATYLTNQKHASQGAKKRWLKVGIYIAITLGLVSSILYATPIFMTICLIVVGLGLKEIIDLQRSRESLAQSTFGRVGLIVYTLIGIACMTFVWKNNHSPEYILYWFILVFTFDSFSQLTGQLLGKHLLFPITSPNKTVEGLIGGLVITLITALFVHQWASLSIWGSFALGIIICLGSLVGDYLASYYKRHYEVKDFNQMIPAHGGILDRFDSLIFSGAILYLLG